MKSIIEQESQYEGFRVYLEENKINLGMIYSRITKYRDDELSIDDFRYHFRRSAMQVTFQEFKLLYGRIDRLN